MVGYAGSESRLFHLFPSEFLAYITSHSIRKMIGKMIKDGRFIMYYIYNK